MMKRPNFNIKIYLQVMTAQNNMTPSMMAHITIRLGWIEPLSANIENTHIYNIKDRFLPLQMLLYGG